jgi:riboflavin biosynthesis pyrimidine reductase
MMPSVDGRLRTERWDIPKQAHAEYERTGASHRADAWMCGRKTMEEFASASRARRRAGRKRIERADLVIPRERGAQYAVAIDAHARLEWKRADIDGDPLVAVLTEDAPDASLESLREKGVSYLFGGKRAGSLDLALVLEKLGSLFGVRRLLLEGGGEMNGSFLRAGLIDELSLLFTPVADGGPGEPALFDVEGTRLKQAVTSLRLGKVRRIAAGMLWVGYRVENRRKRR